MLIDKIRKLTIENYYLTSKEAEKLIEEMAQALIAVDDVLKKYKHSDKDVLSSPMNSADRAYKMGGNRLIERIRKAMETRED